MNKEREIQMLLAAKILAKTPIDQVDKEDLSIMTRNGPVQGAFICGVRWSDRNPESPWVNIDERLPEDSFPELSNPERSRDYIKVMIRLKNDTIMEARRKLYHDRKYYWNIPTRMRDQITHWMPIPLLPVEIANENKEK